MAAILVLAGVAIAEKVERRKEQKRWHDEQRYAELQRNTTRRLSAFGKKGEQRDAAAASPVNEVGGTDGDAVVPSLPPSVHEAEQEEQGGVGGDRFQDGTHTGQELHEDLLRKKEGESIRPTEGDAGKQHHPDASSEGKGKKRWSRVFSLKRNRDSQ